MRFVRMHHSGEGMFDDLTKEIKAQLYERVRSPLLATLVIAWSVWNFRALLVLFSTVSVEQKLKIWEEMYLGVWESFPQAVAFPVLSAVLFLLAYPYPARWAYHYWHWQHRKLKAIQQRIDDDTPMTLEEAKELRRVALEQQTQMQAQLRSLAETNRELSAQRDTMLNQLAELQKTVTARIEEVGRLTSELKAAGQGRESDVPAEATEPADAATKGPDLSSLPDDVQASLAKLGRTHNLAPRQMLVLFIIVRHGGRVERKVIYRDLPTINRVEIDHALDRLEKTPLAATSGGVNGSVFLTEAGREAAVKSGLARYSTEGGI